MNKLSEAIARIAFEVHPERIETICSAFAVARNDNILGIVKNCLGEAFSPSMIEQLRVALGEHPQVTVAEVSAMFRVSAKTVELMTNTSSVELVWTGPGTSLVPIRHTEQVLTGLIDGARERLFLVSFVAYNVGSVIRALQRAIERRVIIRVLIERSKEHGGNVTVDSVAMLKQNLAQAQLYEWDKTTGNASQNASVHAKCATADGEIAFVTSANLSEAAMERNMELGVLIRGGLVPRLLEQHLTALITSRQLRAL